MYGAKSKSRFLLVISYSFYRHVDSFVLCEREACAIWNALLLLVSHHVDHYHRDYRGDSLFSVRTQRISGVVYAVTHIDSRAIGNC